jgi:WhiB family transcriptional regulator, redox-sensing transcriptional regulator
MHTVSTYSPQLVLDVTDMAWADDGDCQYADPELWFPAPGERAEAAKSICAQCPVKAECLAYAMPRSELEGIWGGTSQRQRARMRVKAQLAPRKHAEAAALAAEGMKRCTRCRHPKPYAEFSLDSHSRDGRRPDCKACLAARGWRKEKAA